MNTNFFKYGGLMPGDQIVTMYMAQTPYDPSIPNQSWPTPTITPYVPSPVGTTITVNTVNLTDIQLNKLLEAVFELRGQTHEIYKLKTIAYGIKAELNDE
jgi:hypothetical protein